MFAHPTILNDAAVAAALETIDVRHSLKEMFASLDAGRAVQPPQTLSLFPGGEGDFITYLGVLADHGVFGAKLSPYLPRAAGPLVTAWTLLMSMRTGAPLLLCDAKQLTTERTAGTTALAVDLLAAPDASRITIIGTGAVGMAHLAHVLPLRRWKDVVLCSPNAMRKTHLLHRLGCSARLEYNPCRAVASADVVMLCTSSGKPVIDVADTLPHALITSISTNSANAHEVDPAALSHMDVYCDYAATTPATAGEMQLAAAQGLWSADQLIGDLPGLVSGRLPAPRMNKRRFFRSVGLGLEDLVLAHAIHKSLTKDVAT